jgi:hypothetical protein
MVEGLIAALDKDGPVLAAIAGVSEGLRSHAV